MVLITGCKQQQVDAFYYPDRNDLTSHEFFPNVGSIDACRKVVYQAAARNNDPLMKAGDYECGINPTGRKFGDITIYETTEK